MGSSDVTPVLLIPLPPSPRPSGIWAVGPCPFSRLTLKGCFLFPCTFVARWPHPSPPPPLSPPPPRAEPPVGSKKQTQGWSSLGCVMSGGLSPLSPAEQCAAPAREPSRSPRDDSGTSFQHYPVPGSSSLGEQTKGRGKNLRKHKFKARFNKQVVK